MTEPSDHSFDAIIEKFAQNIYGSTKGRLRHELLVHHLKYHINYAQPTLDKSLQVIDVGAGTGIMSAEFARYGHQVTFNDISNDALGFAKGQLSDFNNVHFLSGSLSELSMQNRFDIVLCHAVLEWLVDPHAAIVKLLSLLKPGGHLSLSFFNQDAHRFGNLLYGNFDYVMAGMPQKNTVRLNPKNALSPNQILTFIETLDVTVLHTAGLRCFHDYLYDRDKQIEEYDVLKKMEIEYGTQSPYKWLGKYFHVILRKKSPKIIRG